MVLAKRGEHEASLRDVAIYYYALTTGVFSDLPYRVRDEQNFIISTTGLDLRLLQSLHLVKIYAFAPSSRA